MLEIRTSDREMDGTEESTEPTPFLVDYSRVTGTVWPDWAILKGLGDKFSCNNSPNILKLFGPFEKCHYLNIICCGYFLGFSWENFGYFIFLHLVTLYIYKAWGYTSIYIVEQLEWIVHVSLDKNNHNESP